MIELDKEMIEGLKGIGFKHDVGENETGHQMKYFRRGGGYNLDAGSLALMIKGELSLLQHDPRFRGNDTGVIVNASDDSGLESAPGGILNLAPTCQPTPTPAPFRTPA
jgi:hypothetical protein